MGTRRRPVRKQALASQAGEGPSPRRVRRDIMLAAVLLFMSGVAALVFQIIWIKQLSLVVGVDVHAVTLAISAFFAGLGMGGLVLGRLADRAAPSRVALFYLALAWTGDALAGASARFVAAAASIVLGPTLLLGAAFPLALRLATRSDIEGTGRTVGAVICVNTLGGVGGAAITGFVLTPALGLVRTLGLLAMTAALTGLVAIWRERPAAHWARVGGWGVAGFAALLLVTTPAGRLAGLLVELRRGALVAYEEAQGATVAVLEQGVGRNTFRRLYIHGVSNSGDAMPSLRYMRLQALLPLIIHPGEPKSALVIGMGTGITAGALSRYPGLDKRVVAELLPAVVRAAPHFTGNYGVAGDPRMDIRLRDGRRELLRSAERYDLIRPSRSSHRWRAGMGL